MHIALALQLIALVSGVLLINKAFAADFFCKKTGMIIGSLVALISILSVVCIVAMSFKRTCHRDDRPMMPSMPSNWQHPPIDGSMDMFSPPHGEDEMPKPKKP